jgi:transcriptional regulator with XRE-family HTH domain
MGKQPRPRPARLGEKLRQIRLGLGLSQSQMLRRLGLDRKLYSSAVSGYEIGTREPPIPVLLKYARIAGVPMEALADDDLELPKHLPGKPDHEWVMQPVRVGRPHRR